MLQKISRNTFCYVCEIKTLALSWVFHNSSLKIYYSTCKFGEPNSSTSELWQNFYWFLWTPESCPDLKTVVKGRNDDGFLLYICPMTGELFQCETLFSYLLCLKILKPNFLTFKNTSTLLLVLEAVPFNKNKLVHGEERGGVKWKKEIYFCEIFQMHGIWFLEVLSFCRWCFASGVLMHGVPLLTLYID